MKQHFILKPELILLNTKLLYLKITGNKFALCKRFTLLNC